MALGLAIIFGQMGVINMAHGEFLTIGAYTTYLLSEISQRWAPWLHNDVLPHRDRGRLPGRRNCGVGGRAGHGAQTIQTSARHPAGDMGLEPDHAADLPLAVRREGSQRRPARLADGLAEANGLDGHPDQRSDDDGRDGACSRLPSSYCCSRPGGASGSEPRRKTESWRARAESTPERSTAWRSPPAADLAGIAGAAFTTIGSTGPPADRSTSSTRFWSSCSEVRRASSAPSLRPSASPRPRRPPNSS